MTERWYVLQFENVSGPTFYDGSRYATASLRNAKKYAKKADAISVGIKVTREWYPVKVVPIEIRVVEEE